MATGVVCITLHLSKFLAVFLIFISMLPAGAFIYGHIYGNGIQQWINKEEGVKIEFKYTLSLKLTIIIN